MNLNQDVMEYWFQDIGTIGYEIIHQLILEKLLKERVFAGAICGIDQPPKQVQREPYRGKFDLSVLFPDEQECLVEMKMWSGLGFDQIKRQTQFLKEKEERKGIYLLLGTSDFEHSPEMILEQSDGQSIKISYKELIQALDILIDTPGSTAMPKALIKSYRKALAEQNNWLRNAWRQRADVHPHFYLYSAYRNMQELMPEIRTSIYTKNRGGADYIFQSLHSWTEYAYGGGSGKLYLEIINGELCIRFKNEEGDMETRRQIREHLVELLYPHLENKYPQIRYGSRTSGYMKIIRLPMDFERLGMERCVAIFRDWDALVKSFQQTGA